MNTEKEIISVTEFAKRMNVARATVYSAIKSGKVSTIEDPISKIPKIDFTISSIEWTENMSGLKRLQANRALEAKAIKTKSSMDKSVENMTLGEAERKEKVFKAQISELKYLEQSGKLVDVEKVKTQAFDTGRKVRNNILNIPNRIAHELAAETDPHKVENILNAELTKALEELSTGEKK